MLQLGGAPPYSTWEDVTPITPHGRMRVTSLYRRYIGHFPGGPGLSDTILDFIGAELVCWWWHFDRRFAHLIAPVVTTDSNVQFLQAECPSCPTNGVKALKGITQFVFNSNTFVTLTVALVEVHALLNVILVTNVDICNNFKQYRATSCHVALYIRTQGSS